MFSLDQVQIAMFGCKQNNKLSEFSNTNPHHGKPYNEVEILPLEKGKWKPLSLEKEQAGAELGQAQPKLGLYCYQDLLH